MNSGQHILVVDDEPAIAETLVFALERECFQATHVSLGRDAIRALERERFALVILDVGLPDMTGFDVCRDIRAVSDVPVLFLTARDDEIDRILGLELGGDDYVTKPFSPREVVARVRAILKRMDKTSAPATVLEYDRRGHCLRYRGHELPLTATELRIAVVLLGAPGRVFSRGQLLDAMEAGEDVLDRSVDTHIKTLRAKLRDCCCAERVRTHRGLGYSLEKP